MCTELEPAAMDSNKRPYGGLKSVVVDNNKRPYVEFEQKKVDLLAVVVNCSAIQYTTDQSKHFREAIVIDQRVKHNERMLLSYTLRSSSLSSSSLNLAPIEDQVLAISTIPELLSTVQSFPVEDIIAVLNHFTCLCARIVVSLCAPKLRKWCHFEVNIMDASDTIMVMISETLGERILSLTTEQISVQLQKPLFRFPDQKAGTLAITSFTEIPLSTEEPGPKVAINYVTLTPFADMTKEIYVPDEYSVPAILSVCGYVQDLLLGMQVHGYAFVSGTIIGSTLIDMYNKCSDNGRAQKVFESWLPERHVPMWNSMLSGYINNGLIEDAKVLFEDMPEKTIISWTSMMTRYVQKDLPEEGLNLLAKMYSGEEGSRIEGNCLTFIVALEACSHLTDLDKGK
ncbi:hypothetical protein FXO37_08768 [Capsicum annuum]|nr:hypothetical protein FXO37_08768 [Capsicum annuum]